MEELEIKGQKYISSKRAAKLTGYAKDYVGQLARGGKVSATRVGRAWYVSEEEILAHAGVVTEEEPAPEENIAPQSSQSTSLYSLNHIKSASRPSKLTTWSSVTYLPDDKPLIPEKIKTVEYQRTVHEIPTKNIDKSAVSTTSDSHPVHLNKVQQVNRAPSEKASVLSDFVVPRPQRKQQTLKPVQQKSSLKLSPTLSPLLLGVPTALFLTFILSSNVVPVEWGFSEAQGASVSLSLPETFFDYLKGIAVTAFTILKTFLSVLVSSFESFVSSGLSFLLKIF